MTATSESLVLFVDLQEGLIETSRTQAARDIRRSAGVLLTVASALEIPCAASVIPFGAGPAAPLIRELVQAERVFEPLERHSVSAMDAVRPPRDRLILCGMVMEAAVLHTALAARALGLEVEVPLDVCGGLSQRTEEAAIRQMERAGVNTTSVASFATGCIEGAARPTRARVMQALQQLLSSQV